MKEFDLTPRPQNPYPKGGDIFMDQGQNEQPPIAKESQAPKANLSPENLRREWIKTFTEEELKNPDTRSTIETAIKMSLAPHEVTSKGAIRQTAQEVFKNAQLNDEERLKKAEEILGRKITKEEGEAILNAHYEGGKEEGKEERKAGVYNYTPEQLLRKAEILKKAGFSAEQRRALIEAGIAATPIPIDEFTDRILREMIEILNNEVRDVGIGRPLSQRFVNRQLGRLYDAIYDGSVNVEEGRILARILHEWERETASETGRKEWEPVINGLMDATRNNNVGRIEELIRDNFIFTERSLPIEDLINISFAPEAINNNLYGYALEYAIENTINIADKTPEGSYPELTFTQRENLAELITQSRDKDRDSNKRFAIYLKELVEKRQLSHDLFRSMKSKGAYEKYVGEHLRNEGFNFLENEIAGVSEAKKMWDKVLGGMVGDKSEYLNQKDFNKAHEEVLRLFKKDAALVDGSSTKLKKTFSVRVNGTEIVIERSLREWEIDRAAVVGRSVGSTSGRSVSYGVLGDLPKKAADLWTSLYAEYVARTLAGRKIIGQRFISKGSSASAEYMKTWIDKKKKIARGKGLYYGDGKNGLYGHNIDSWVLLDSGVPDLQTHSWRSRLLFLRDEDYAKIEGGGVIGDYIDNIWNEIDNKDFNLERAYSEAVRDGGVREEDRNFLNDKSLERVTKEDRIKRIVYSHRVRRTVLNQRLYLGIISREPNFTPRLKEEIWKNVARYTPSRIAAFFPNERRDLGISNEVWIALRDKLFLAETDRVREQARRVKEDDFREVSLSDFYEAQGVTEEEQRIIDQIITLGQEKAGILARTIFPFTAYLEDAPRASYMNLGQEDVGRLLVSDYEGYNAGTNSANQIAGNPAMRLAQSAELLVKAKDGYAAPIGPDGAQEQLEADILTRYEMYAMNKASKWYLYGIKKFLRSPTSKIEKYNIDAGISMTEEAIARDAEFLAQNSVINSDTTKRDAFGATQLERVKKKAKATVRWIWFMYARMLALLLPAVMATELIKALMPRELLKAA